MENTDRSKTQKQRTDKRKVLLINPSFQLTFLAFSGAISISIIIILFLANTYFFWKFDRLGHDLHLKADHVIFQFLGYEKVTLGGLFFVCYLSIFFVLGTFGLVFSHRIAGPLYKLRKHILEDSARGEITPVYFRKRDFFQEIAEAYNQMVSKKHK